VVYAAFLGHETDIKTFSSASISENFHAKFSKTNQSVYHFLPIVGYITNI